MRTAVAPVLMLLLAAMASGQPASRPAENLLVERLGSGVARLEGNERKGQVTFLGWDTEGGDRSTKNLLRAPLVLRWTLDGKVQSSGEIAAQPRKEAAILFYRLPIAPAKTLSWGVRPSVIEIAAEGKEPPALERLEMVFPFDPGLTPTTVLPADCGDDGRLTLPAIISAPDYGQMLLTCTDPAVTGRLEGSRAEHRVDFILDIPPASLADPLRFHLQPVYLPLPEGFRNRQAWRKVRRGWFNIFQPTARWGEAGKPFSAPPGLLGNNVLSDPCSLALWFYADQAFWTPELAPGISATKLVRRTIDFWLDQRTRPTGEVIGYWEYGNFLDANAGPIIAAWDYVEATGDREWLARRIERIEFIADFLARRDVDSDGMIEAVQSGNRGTLQQPARSCAWWDALNCGHKDGYTNAIIYRAFRCLADLELKAGRKEQAERYTRFADRLKGAYFKNLYNPKTGWLAWWKSQDGELHDYASPVVNGLAIEYGLVEADQAKDILDRLRAKMKEVGFRRYDLGIPGVLVPVPRADYLLPDSLGCPRKEDGTDTFGQYMNGGISAGQGTHFIAAHYLVGHWRAGDVFLNAMLTRQAAGLFHNGVRDAQMQGLDWTTWDGKPCGYEGYLADSFRFTQLVLLRYPQLRERFYRPLLLPTSAAQSHPASRPR